MKIYARHCAVGRLDETVANDFVASWHRQGSTIEKTHSVGLYYNEELVGVMQFCYPRTSGMQSKYTRELLRMAFKDDIRVVGGASKLFQYYVKTNKPADIFTYQDTTGELTSVYERCGMKLVKQDKKKAYLVAPGKTLSTGSRKEILGLPYATRYGPDRILGTKLGEVFDEQGQRLTNVQLFTEKLGWTLVETTGDRIYEWFNENISFYTYKLTAPNSDKYYYGVKSIRLPNPTAEDCLSDGYLGSGRSEHFLRWRKKYSLEKEILGIYRRKSLAYAEEKKLVGELYKIDPLCLNSAPGGAHGGLSVENKLISEKSCSKHGLYKHIGSTCYKCIGERGYEVQTCPTHGLTTHRGSACLSCEATKKFTQGQCEKHGSVTFRSGKCDTCRAEGLITEAECELHGLTPHRAGRCSTCVAQSAMTEAECATHGVSKHQGGKCMACHNEGNLHEAKCEVHGPTTFIGSTCRKCSSARAVTEQECPKHGMTAFQGEKCAKCHSQKSVTMKECPTHGVVKHRGETCQSCLADKRKSVEECEHHGLTDFYNGSCTKCRGAKVSHTRSHKAGLVEGCLYC